MAAGIQPASDHAGMHVTWRSYACHRTEQVACNRHTRTQPPSSRIQLTDRHTRMEPGNRSIAQCMRKQDEHLYKHGHCNLYRTCIWRYAIAQTLSQEQYKLGQERITADYKSAVSACDSFAGNAKDICKAEASGSDKIAKAQLDARYRPSAESSFNLRVAQADAQLSVAKERCDDKAGNVKDVCLKEAKAVELAAKADAKARMKTANANEQAARTSATANNKAGAQGDVARRDAAATKRDADYAVAKEKCDTFSGDAKNNCLNEARARFDRS